MRTELAKNNFSEYNKILASQERAKNRVKKKRKPEDALKKAHARYGPSSMKRIVECQVSAFLSKGMPDSKSTYSKDGDLAHELAEIYLDQILCDQKFKTPELSKTGLPFNNEMRRCGKAYARYCYDVVAPLIEEFGEENCQWYIEKRLTLDKDLQIWGTADFVFLYMDKKSDWHIIIIDFKYGAGIAVFAEDNWQLPTYCLAGIVTFEEEIDGEIVDAETHIFQPRSDHKTEPQKYSREDLTTQYGEVIYDVVQRSQKWFEAGKISNADLEKYQNAGGPKDDWCRFCRAQGQCKSYAAKTGFGRAVELFTKAEPQLKKMQKEADRKHAEHKVRYANGLTNKKPKKPNVFEDQRALKATGVFSDEDFAWIAMNKSKITAFVETATKVLKNDLMNGRKNPFVKLGKASPHREFDKTDEAYLIAELKKKGIKKPYEVTKSLITLTAAERIVGKGELDHLVKVAYETHRVCPIDEKGVKPVAPRGLDVAALFGMSPNEDAQEEVVD